MKPSGTDVRERLILAAIDRIEHEGLEGATTRSVARAAGVNSAAVNYYFGSKRRLFDAALKRTLYNAFLDTPDGRVPQGGGPRAELRLMLVEFLAGALSFPGLTLAHLNGPLMHRDYSGAAVREFRGYLERLEELVRAAAPGLGRRAARLTVVQVMSAITSVALLPGLFSDPASLDVTVPAQREEFIDYLLERYLGRAAPGGRRRK